MLNAGQDEITSIYQSYWVFSLLFSQKISTKHKITSTEISYQFLALKVTVLRRNKATNSSCSFQLQRKPLYQVIYSSLKDLPSHSQGHFAIGDNEKNKTIVIFSSSLSPSGKLPVRRSSLKTLNKLPSTRAFSAAEKWTVRSNGVGGFTHSSLNGILRRKKLLRVFRR